MINFDWFTLAVISSIALSLANITQKYALKNQSVDPIAFSIFYQLLVALITVPLAAGNIGKMPSSINIWLIVSGVGLMYAVINAVYFYALKTIEVSEANIISSAYSLWVLIGGFIFFNEDLDFLKVSGVLLIVTGILSVFLTRGGIKGFGKAQFLVMSTPILSAAAAALNKIILNYFEQSTYQVISFLIPPVLTALFMPKAVRNIGQFFKMERSNIFVIAAALFSGLATFTLFSALKIGEVSRIGPVVQSSVILTVLMGVILLKERERTLNKFAGAAIVFLSSI